MCRLCNKRSRSKNRRIGRMFANGYNNPYRVNIYGNVGNVVILTTLSVKLSLVRLWK